MTSKKISCFAIVLILFISTLVRAQNSTIIPGNIIVMLHSKEEAQQLSNILSHVNGISTHLKLKSTLSKNMNIFLFEFDSLAINQELMLQLIKVNSFVKIAQFNHTLQLRNTPLDSLFNKQWNMNNTGQLNGTPGVDIEALKAWDITTGGLTSQGDTIVVAVIDGGFDLQHEDLNFWKNHQEIPNNNMDDDDNGYVDDYDGWNGSLNNDNLPVEYHGTHVCGIVGAKGCNHIGVTGVNWNVKIMPVSTGSSSSGKMLSEADVVTSYTYVFDQRKLYNITNGAKGAFVVSTNSSFGIDLGQPGSYPLWCAMYDSLGSVGIISAAATTDKNYNVDTQGDMPTACSSNWLVTVTSTNNNDLKPTDRGYGLTTIDLAAPGENIFSTYYNPPYAYLSGTSMSCPHIAGAIALMYSVGCQQFMTDCKNNPAEMALVVKDSLLKTTDKINSLAGITVTGGRLNLYKAVQSIVNYYPGETCVTSTKECVESKTIAKIGFRIKNTYPNPTNGILNISYECNSDAVIRLYNMLGEELQYLNVSKSDIIQKATLDLSTLDKGIYFIYMSNGSARSASFKVVVAPDMLKP
jgi:subtilisin family serine protease